MSTNSSSLYSSQSKFHSPGLIKHGQSILWSYIVGMPTNLDSLPIQRIHQMLKLFATNGSGVEFTQDDLKVFLQSKVRDHKLIYSGGVCLNLIQKSFCKDLLASTLKDECALPLHYSCSWFRQQAGDKNG
uniref:APC2 domain-containing protein n=1 Tax=Glossina pallidipes TaxID=7398 RepID=A0A1A9ZXG6_GLOPL